MNPIALPFAALFFVSVMAAGVLFGLQIQPLWAPIPILMIGSCGGAVALGASKQ